MNDGLQLVQITRRKQFAENEFWTMMSALYERQWENLVPPQIPIEDLPSKVVMSFVTPPDAPVPDCLSCGACCTFLFVIGLNSVDQTPPENVWDVTQETKESQQIIIDRFLRRDEKTFHCAALNNTKDNQKMCGIYEQRPRPCRNFEAGSDKCHSLRRLYGFEPELTMMEMFSAVEVLEAKAAVPISAEKIRRVKIVEDAETDNLTIVAVMADDSNKLLHSFDPKREFWLQFEFAGLTFAAARDLIHSRNNAGKLN